MSLFLETSRKRRRSICLDALRFLSPDAPPFELNGFPWREKGAPFRRFPDDLKPGILPPLVDSLADFPSGGELRFRTDSSRILIWAEFSAIHRISRMAETGVMGFDLYCGKEGEERFCGVLPAEREESGYCAEIFRTEQRELRSFTLYFPLFAKVEHLEIGLEEGSRLEAPHPRAERSALVAYGTSILQGACAGRPGLAYPARLSRLLRRPVWNFGFAGNARGEASVARLLASLESPGAFLLDYDVNTTADSLRQTLPEFIRILRERHPETPIVHLSSLAFPSDLGPDGARSPPSDRTCPHSSGRGRALSPLRRAQSALRGRLPSARRRERGKFRGRMPPERFRLPSFCRESGRNPPGHSPESNRNPALETLFLKVGIDIEIFCIYIAKRTKEHPNPQTTRRN